MKICYFLGDISTTGGIERVLSTLTKEQVKDDDLDITIVSQFHSFKNPNYEFDNKIKIVYLTDKIFDGAPGSWRRLIHHLETIRNVKDFFNKNKYDIILAQAFPNIFTLWIAGIFNICPIVGVEHVHFGYYNRFIRFIRHKVYKSLARLVVLTKNDKTSFTNEGIINTIVIPNPIASRHYKCSDLQSKKIILVGRLVYQKGFDSFIKLYKPVYERHPEWRVEIYGDGVLRNALSKQINAENLSEVIELKGNTSSMDEKYCQASIFVLSSRFEGFSMVLLEAMSHGLACLAYDCPNGPSDLISNEENGILVRNQDSEKLASELNRLIEDVNLRHKLGDAAYCSIGKYYVSSIVQKWKDLYNQVLREY